MSKYSATAASTMDAASSASTSKNVQDSGAHLHMANANAEHSDATSAVHSHGRPFTSVETRTQKGYIAFNPGKVNQDRFIIVPDFNQRAEHALFGVFDGHGVHGHLVSTFVSSQLPMLLSKAMAHDHNSSVEEALQQSFAAASDALVHHSYIDSTYSGSTAVVSLVTPTHYYTANTGDSRVVLARQASAAHSEVLAYALSSDHKAERADERQRIEARGGRVQPYRASNGDAVGPDRVWLGNRDVPGLAMTRAFGDTVAASVGVTSQPELTVQTRTEGDRFLIFASDGVWEFLSDQDAVDIVCACESPSQACDALIRESTQRWKAEEEVIDDITAVVVFL